MNQRIMTSPVVRGLFSTVAIESGLSDQEIVQSIQPRIPHKTFSRLRVNTPGTITSDQLLMVSRLTQSQTGFCSADVIAMLRNTETYQDHPVYIAGLAKTVSFSTKEISAAEAMCRTFAAQSRRILLFDRSDSFLYLHSAAEPEADLEYATSTASGLSSRWMGSVAGLHYERRPRVSVILTEGSLFAREASHGDLGLEHLIGHVESGEHSLAIVKDSRHLQHRVFRGVFAAAEAVTIFDRHRMVVFPRHQRSFRLYDAGMGSDHARLIHASIAEFVRMRRFRTHLPTIHSVVGLMRKRLSYQVPGWRIGLSGSSG